jgi:hypothetical protein
MSEIDEPDARACSKCNRDVHISELRGCIRWDKPFLCILEAFSGEVGTALFAEVCKSCRRRIQCDIVASIVIVIALCGTGTAMLFGIWYGVGFGGIIAVLALSLHHSIISIVKRSIEKSGNSIQVLKSGAADAREAQADEPEADDESE